jgi:uncharacterized membrane protein YraQ (UPF0718 family)
MSDETVVATGGGSAARPRVSRRAVAIGVGIFFLIAVLGITYAKWWPYTAKTAGVLSSGTLSGTSSVTGGAATAPAPSWHAAWSFALGYFQAIWVALLIALVIGAAMEALLPKKKLVAALSAGPRSLGGSAAGGALAIPSMMCTCCTAPLAVSLRRRGVPTGSALSYWLGNPVLNPAVLVFLAVLLPWQWVAVRIVAGVLLVFAVVPLIARLAAPKTVPEPASMGQDAEDDEMVTGRAAVARFARSFGKLAIGLIPEYIVVVFAVGVARAWLFPLGGQLASWGILAILLLAVTGALFVIPTAGEIPIILGLLTVGIGAGPAGALLLALPALSLPSLVMVGRSFPKRTLAAAFGTVVLLGLCCGLVLAAIT